MKNIKVVPHKKKDEKHAAILEQLLKFGFHNMVIDFSDFLFSNDKKDEDIIDAEYRVLDNLALPEHKEN